MAANIRFYAKNIFDDATVSAFSEDSEYPDGNMQHTHRTLRWHSTSLAEQYIRFDVGVGGQIAGYIAVVNPNITSGNLTVKATNNADYVSDLLLNESFAVSPKIFGYGQEKYGQHGYGGTLLTTEMGRYAPGGRVLIHHFTAGLVGARYWSLIIPVTCGSEDAYFAIGRIFAGTWYEPEYNMATYALCPIDASNINLSAGGQPWLDVAPKRRAMRIGLPKIVKSEARYEMFDLFQQYGRRQDIIISAFSEWSEEQKMFDTIYGRFESTPGIEWLSPNFYSAPEFMFMESL